MDHAYGLLTPDAVVVAVESAGFECDGRLLALNSYENRVYQVGLEGQHPIIAKFYRPERWTDEAILEEHRFAIELNELDIPVVAPLTGPSGSTLLSHGLFKFALFPRRAGRWPELDTVVQRTVLGRLLGRIHRVGAARPFKQRPAINVAGYAWAPLAHLRACTSIPPDQHDNVLMAAEVLLGAVAERAAFDAVRMQRIHGDFHLGNVLMAGDGPSVVDLDDCCTGPAVQDLWMLLSGNAHQRAAQLNDVLAGYTEFADFDQRELAVIEGLRALRMVRYNGWIAERWHDPAFERAFPWFTTPRYWEEQIISFREQLEALNEPPLQLMSV
ncbi:MAG: serine/threonine protein kinase [Gammaproteobacteria bacterium]|nr:serine/threonine protein kinase [Gammaproteobacteria bacterium]